MWSGFRDGGRKEETNTLPTKHFSKALQIAKFVIIFKYICDGHSPHSNWKRFGRVNDWDCVQNGFSYSQTFQDFFLFSE